MGTVGKIGTVRREIRISQITSGSSTAQHSRLIRLNGILINAFTTKIAPSVCIKKILIKNLVLYFSDTTCSHLETLKTCRRSSDTENSHYLILCMCVVSWILNKTVAASDVSAPIHPKNIHLTTDKWLSAFVKPCPLPEKINTESRSPSILMPENTLSFIFTFGISVSFSITF